MRETIDWFSLFSRGVRKAGYRINLEGEEKRDPAQYIFNRQTIELRCRSSILGAVEICEAKGVWARRQQTSATGRYIFIRAEDKIYAARDWIRRLLMKKEIVTQVDSRKTIKPLVNHARDTGWSMIHTLFAAY